MGVALVGVGTAAWSSITRDFNGGVYLYKRGDYELAARTFEAILSKYPNHSRTDEILFWYGESINQLGQVETALGIYRRLIAEYPASKWLSKARFAAGVASMRRDQYADAAADFASVLADPSTEKDRAIDCRIHLAECHLKSGNDKQAELVLREVLALPKVPPDKRQAAEYELAKLALRAGRTQEAMALFARVAERAGPRQAEAFMALGDNAYMEGKYIRSLEWYEKVIRAAREAPPGFRTRAVYNGAWSYLALGEMDKSYALFSEVLDDAEAMPEVRGDAAIRMAQILREKGRGPQAEEQAAAAFKIAEDHRLQKLVDEVLFLRAEWSYLDKQYDAAQSFLARTSARGYRFMRLTGQILFDLGRPADASLYFDSAANLAPSRDDANLCCFDLAQSFFVAGAFDSALGAIDRIKNPNPSLSPRLRPFFAGALLQAGRPKEAARLYEKLMDEEAGVDTIQAQRYRYYAALAYVQARHITQAGKLLDLYLQTSAGTPADSLTAAALLIHADVLAAQKKYPEALDAYRRSVDAAAPFGPENIYLAHSRRLDFAVQHAKDQVDDFAREFVSSIGDSRPYRFVIDRLYEAGLYPRLLTYTSVILDRFSDLSDLYGKALYYQMLAHHKLENPPAAMESQTNLDRWLADHPTADLSEESDFWRARLAQQIGDRPTARNSYQKYLQLHPAGKYVTESKFNLGLVALEDNDAESAEREFLAMLAGRSETDVRSTPLLADVRYNLASVRILQGRFAEAAEILESLSKTKTYQTDAACLYKLGYVYGSMRRDTEAEGFFRQVIAQKRAPAAVVDNALHALFSLLYRTERGKDLETEFKRLAARIQDKTTEARVRFILGMTLFTDPDRLDDAAAYFKSIQQTGDTDLEIEATLRLADCHYNLRRYGPALEGYSRIADRFLDSKWGLEALYAAGLCKVRLGLSAEAIAGFEQLLRDQPNGPLAREVAREAALLYVAGGDLDRAEDKLDFLEKRNVEGPLLEEARRLRIRIWQTRGNAEKVLDLARAYRTDHGLNAEVSLSAAESAIKLGRFEDAADLLDGFDAASVDTRTRDSINFYRAEALRLQDKPGAAELYRKLIDSSDSDIRLAARYRHGIHLMDQKDFSKAKMMLGSAVSDPSIRTAPFFQDALRRAFAASKESHDAAEVARLYETFKPHLEADRDKLAAAEYNLWACLALKDPAKTLAAADDLLALKMDPRRQTEVMLIQAQLHETLKDPDRADAILSGVLRRSDAPDDLRQAAEEKKIQMAVARGGAGRRILEDHLKQGRKGRGTERAAESLLSNAVLESRHADVIRITRLMEDKLDSIPTAARYARAMAHAALGDTAEAIDQFRRVAHEHTPDTFHAAWAAYRVGQEELARRLRGASGAAAAARTYLQISWRWRSNLDRDAAETLFRQLADVLFELSDASGLKAMADDPAPAGISGGPALLKGQAAWLEKDYAGAARRLKEIPNPDERLRLMIAESLKLSADTAAAIAVYEEIAEGDGAAAARAALEAAVLYESIGRTTDGLIACYKILAEYEADTETDLGADALLTICKLYTRVGDPAKLREAVEELDKKFPRSRQSKEASKLLNKRAVGMRPDRK